MRLTIFGSYNRTSIGDKAILISLLDLLFRVGPSSLIIEILALDKAAIEEELGSYPWYDRVEVHEVFTSRMARKVRSSSSGNVVRKRIKRLLPHLVAGALRSFVSVRRRPKNLPGNSIGLLIGGGNILMDMWPGWPIAPYLISKAFHAKGRPIVVIGAGALPLNTVYQTFVRRTCQMCSKIYVRDDHSKDALQNRWGIKSSVHPDLAFSIPLPKIVSNRTPTLAVNVANVFSEGSPLQDGATNQVYLDGIARQLSRIIDSNEAIERIWIFNTNFPGDKPASDKLYGLLLKYGLVDEQISYESRALTVHELISKLSTCHMALTTRLHAAILSLVAGLPVITVEYQPKVRHVLHLAGVSRVNVGIDQLDKIREMFSEMHRDKRGFSLDSGDRKSLDAVNRAVVEDVLGSFTGTD